MRKKLFTFAFFVQIVLYGQQQQSSSGTSYEPLIPIRKQELLKDIDVIFNTRVAFDSRLPEGKYENSKFDMNQFRLEIKGKIHERVYFRFRNRYTKSANPGLDNISQTTDMAFVGLQVAPKTSITAGKLCADWGGYEFDLNPINVLEYNDLLDHENAFLTGVGVSHKLNDKHSLGIQVLNSRSVKFEEVYAGKIPPGVDKSKAPLAFVTNWRGSFFDGKFETCYSFSYFTEATNRTMSYIAFGNKYHNKNFTLMYDFHYSNDGLDRKFIISNLIDHVYPYAAEDVHYLAHWLRVDYRITPKINLSLSLMTNDNYWQGNPDSSAPSKLYTSYGYIPTVEFIPFKDFDLKFYIAYIGRNYNYSSYAKNVLGHQDFNSGRISVGLIAPLLVM